MGLNRVELIGYIGTELKLITIKSGAVSLKIRLATREYFSSYNGTKYHIEWHTVVFWGKNAQNLNRYARKGLKIFVEGRIRTCAYSGNNGERLYSTVIVASNFQILSYEKSLRAPLDEEPPFPLEEAPINEETKDLPQGREELPF